MKTNMKKKILKKVLEVCNKRLSKHSELDNFPHYSFVVKNGKIISWAKNSKAEPPLHYG